MPDYTTPRGIPFPLKGDRIAATEENLRLLLKAIAEKTDQQIGAEGSRAAQAAFDALDPRLVAAEGVTKSGPLYFRGTLPEGTDFHKLTKRSDIGIWTVSSTFTYLNRPENLGARVAGMARIVGTGLGDTSIRVDYRSGGGTYEAEQASATTFRAWRRIDRADDALRAQVLALETSQAVQDSLIEILFQIASAQPLQTAFEVNGGTVFTTREQGDAYTNLFGMKYAGKAKVSTVGASRMGNPIKAVTLGDPTKPTLYVMSTQHGDEVGGREAAYQWMRELAESTDPALATYLTKACIVIVPTVNVDSVNVQRLSSSSTDLNRNWATRTTAEIQAAASVFATHNVTLTVDAHEGGSFTHMQMDTPSAPAVAASLKTMSDALYDAVWADFIAAGEPIAEYVGSDDTDIARNNIPINEKSSVLLFEAPNLLAPQQYHPDPKFRVRLYLTAYRSVLKHHMGNLAAYSAAKTAAGG